MNLAFFALVACALCNGFQVFSSSCCSLLHVIDPERQQINSSYFTIYSE